NIGRRQADVLFQVGLHYWHKALLVRLLVDLDLNISGFHHFKDLRHQIEDTQEHLAWRDIAILENLGYPSVPESHIEVSGRIEMGIEIRSNPVEDGCEIRAQIELINGHLPIRVYLFE